MNIWFIIIIVSLSVSLLFKCREYAHMRERYKKERDEFGRLMYITGFEDCMTGKPPRLSKHAKGGNDGQDDQPLS